MTEFQLDGHVFRAERLVDGVLMDPELPTAFDNTPNEDRSPHDVERWAMRPYIVTVRYTPPRDETLHEDFSAAWERAWPTGIRYDVRCLDFGCWDRSTGWGCYGFVEEALACIRSRTVVDFRDEMQRGRERSEILMRRLGLKD